MPAIALASAAFLFGSVSVVAERPVEEFTEPNPIGWARISPGGTKVAAEMDINGERKIVILPYGTPGTATVIGKPEETEIYRVSWVNDDWLVAPMGKKGHYFGYETYFSRVIAFRADGTDMRVLEQRKIDMLPYGGGIPWIANDGTPRILLEFAVAGSTNETAYFPQVAMVDVSTGEFSRAASPMQDISDWYADGEGNVRLGVGAESGGTRARLVYRPDGKGLFKEIQNVDVDEELIAPQLFLADGKRALTISNIDGFDAVYELDLDTMQLGGKVFGVDGYDVSSIIDDATGTKLVGITWRDQRSRVQWFDEKMQAVQNILNLALPGSSPVITSSSRDFNRHTVYTTGSDGIEGYYVFDFVKKSLTPLSKNSSGKGWAQPESFRYKARDGLEIETIVTLPPGKDAKNLPVLIMPHGGPRARDSESWDTWAQFFADRGYAVIQPNFRGSTGYGVEFERAGLGEWGLKMQDDVDDALAWAAKEGMVDPKRACIIGGSYGGYVAMRAAERNPDLYRCAISFAGISDLGKMMRHDSEGYWGKGARKYWRGQLSDVDGVSPINNAAGFGIPILIVHGKEDQRVPVEQSRMIVKELQKLRKDVTYIEQKENDHHFSRDEDMIEFLLASEKFLDKHNPAD